MCENCGCHGSTPEHDHPHTHDHEHGHGHTHDHPHDHQGGHSHSHSHEGHGEDGHTHEHTHEHHDHDHGHTHDHGHHHTEHVHHRDGLTLVEHEGALVASFEGETGEDRGALSARIERLASAITAGGGLVGHIKGTLTESGTTLFSTTGGPVSLSEGGRGGRVQLVAIIFSLSEEELTGIMQRYGFA